MIEPEGDEESCHQVEHEAPGVADRAREHLQSSSEAYEQARGEDGSDAVERRTDAHKVSLFVLVEPEHIKTVGCDVVGGTREGHQPEERQRTLQPEVGRDGEGHTCQ